MPAQVWLLWFSTSIFCPAPVIYLLLYFIFPKTLQSQSVGSTLFPLLFKLLLPSIFPVHKPFPTQQNDSKTSTSVMLCPALYLFESHLPCTLRLKCHLSIIDAQAHYKRSASNSQHCQVPNNTPSTSLDHIPTVLRGSYTIISVVWKLQLTDSKLLT